jgi:hypothetical protein
VEVSISHDAGVAVGAALALPHDAFFSPSTADRSQD